MKNHKMKKKHIMKNEQQKSKNEKWKMTNENDKWKMKNEKTKMTD